MYMKNTFFLDLKYGTLLSVGTLYHNRFSSQENLIQSPHCGLETWTIQTQYAPEYDIPRVVNYITWTNLLPTPTIRI